MRYFEGLCSAVLWFWFCLIITILAVIFANSAAAQTAIESNLALPQKPSSPVNDNFTGFNEDPFGNSSLQNKTSLASIPKKSFSYFLDGGSVRISFTALQAAERRNKKISSSKNGQEDTFYGLIELHLKPGRRTYWRNPGTSGFSPKIELNGGATAEILYPVPQLFDEEGEWIYGYKNQVALPFRIILPQPIKSDYDGSLLIGICDKICMPQKISFHFSPSFIKQNSNNNNKSRLYTAMAMLPKAADKNFGVTHIRVIKDKIEFQLTLPNSTKTALYLDGGDIQLGLPTEQNKPTRATAYSKNGQKNKNNVGIQYYSAPLLFGKVKKDTEIYYIITLADGRAVSGTVKLSKP